MWTCLSPKWAITENQKDCASKIALGGSAQLVYPVIDKADLTVKYSKDPVEIANVGEKTLLQQSNFIGGAVKFWNNLKTATEAGYIVAGNYPDIGNTLKYGQL